MVYKVYERRGKKLQVVASFKIYQDALRYAEGLDAKGRPAHIHIYLAGTLISKFWDNEWRFKRKVKNGQG